MFVVGTFFLSSAVRYILYLVAEITFRELHAMAKLFMAPSLALGNQQNKTESPFKRVLCKEASLSSSLVLLVGREEGSKTASRFNVMRQNPGGHQFH